MIATECETGICYASSETWHRAILKQSLVSHVNFHFHCLLSLSSFAPLRTNQNYCLCLREEYNWSLPWCKWPYWVPREGAPISCWFWRNKSVSRENDEYIRKNSDPGLLDLICIGFKDAESRVDWYNTVQVNPLQSFLKGYAAPRNAFTRPSLSYSRTMASHCSRANWREPQENWGSKMER